MDCAHMDDLCHIEQAYQDRVAIARLNQQVSDNTFSLGVVNGREYTYSEFGGRSYIVIGPAKVQKVGKFEVPSGEPIDCMDSAGGVLNTKIGDSNGKRKR